LLDDGVERAVGMIGRTLLVQPMMGVGGGMFLNFTRQA
jgi:hypothetical protein